MCLHDLQSQPYFLDLGTILHLYAHCDGPLREGVDVRFATYALFLEGKATVPRDPAAPVQELGLAAQVFVDMCIHIQASLHRLGKQSLVEALGALCESNSIEEYIEAHAVPPTPAYNLQPVDESTQSRPNERFLDVDYTDVIMAHANT